VRPVLLEEQADGRLRFEGVAIYENAMSANGRYYPAEFIDESIRRTESFWAGGQATTIHRSHAAWWEGQLPVGRVEKFEHRDGAMRFQAVLSATNEGRDVATLIRDGVVARMSIVSTEYASEQRDLDSGPIDVMQWAVVECVDFCERPGISGAGLTKILESAPTWAKENTMDWKDITLEALRENRTDILNAHVVETIGALMTGSEADKARIVELEAAVAEARAAVETAKAEAAAEDKSAEVTALTEQVTALTTSAKDLEWKVARYEAVAPRWMAALVEELAESDPANLDKEASDKRDAVIAAYRSVPEPEGKGEATEAAPTPFTALVDGVVDKLVIKNTR
jgi:hypothetical protein